MPVVLIRWHYLNMTSLLASPECSMITLKAFAVLFTGLIEYVYCLWGQFTIVTDTMFLLVTTTIGGGGGEGGGISCFFVRQMFSFLKQKSLTSILCMPIDQDQTKWHKISVSDILLFCSTYKNNLNMISLLASPDCSTNSSKHFAVLFAGIHLLSLDEVQTCKGVLVFAYKLYWNGFLATSEHFSQGVDHPCFYSLLKMCLSYRNVKCKLCSFHRYRNFARA